MKVRTRKRRTARGHARVFRSIFSFCFPEKKEFVNLLEVEKGDKCHSTSDHKLELPATSDRFVAKLSLSDGSVMGLTYDFLGDCNWIISVFHVTDDGMVRGRRYNSVLFSDLTAGVLSNKHLAIAMIPIYEFAFSENPACYGLARISRQVGDKVLTFLYPSGVASDIAGTFDQFATPIETRELSFY